MDSELFGSPELGETHKVIWSMKLQIRDSPSLPSPKGPPSVQRWQLPADHARLLCSRQLWFLEKPQLRRAMTGQGQLGGLRSVTAALD